MAKKSTIKLLLINESDNEGERLVSVFRNAGRVVRVQRPASLEELHKLFEKESWDLLIADDKHKEISIEKALEQLKKSKIPLPFIAIRDADAVALLEAGASDVIASGNDQRLVLTAFRELRHLENLRELDQVKEQLGDAEERSKLLMAQSQDAIAYVADGMLISCNALFAERFGYDEPDGLDCVPVIDLIDDADQEKFKGLLKTQLALGEGSTDFNFTGLSHEGSTFAACMQLSNAVLDGESCIQLSVRDPGTTGGGGGSGNADRDYLTNLFSPGYVIAQVDSVAKQAAAGLGTGALLFISVNHFADLRVRHGIGKAADIIRQIAAALRAETVNSACLARFCDDSFALLAQDTDIAQAEKLANALRDTVKTLDVQLGDQHLHCSVSIGIVAVDGKREATAEQLIDNGFSAALHAQKESDTGGVYVFIPAKEKKSVADAGSDADLDKVLEEAIEDGLFVLNFQPVVSLRGTRGDHYEVQPRMINEDGKEIDATEYLRSLNFSEVNTRLDRWILLEASKQLAAQVDAGHDTRLFINLSSNALRDESLIAWLGVALKAGGIPAQAIALQFRESDILECLKPAKVFAKAVKDLGCKIAIAEFGGGNHSQNILKQLGADFAKINSQFTEALISGGSNEATKELVASINEQESQVILSGVENAAALAQLWQLGVDYIQGRYLAGPSRTMDYEFTDIA